MIATRQRLRWHTLTVAWVAAACLAHGGDAAGQTAAVVTGRVLDAETGRPLAAAMVLAIGTSRSAISDGDGRFRLGDLPLRAVEIRAVLIGYASAATTVTPSAVAPPDVELRLTPSAVSIDEVVVTVTGAVRKRELGNATGTVDAATLSERAPITSTNDLLVARIPGVSVARESGTTGTGGRIRIRGSNSLSVSNEPVIYIDGIRALPSTDVGFSVGGQVTSRLDDINPDEIESIEIVKGPSAATLYGTDAANGVIRIQTKRGRAGRARWTAFSEQGALFDVAEYPYNYAGTDEDHPAPFLRRFCTLDFVARGVCAQDEVASFNVLEDPTSAPYGTGRREQYGLNVTGGSDRFQYFLSGEFEEEIGTLRMPAGTVDSLSSAGVPLSQEERRPNAVQRVRLRSNVHMELTQDTDLALSLAYVNGRLRRTDGDLSFQTSPLGSGYFGRAFADERGGWGLAVPAQSLRLISYQDTQRFLGSVQVQWRPSSWLSARGTFGVDVASIHDHQTDVVFSSAGERISVRRQSVRPSVDLGATASFALSPSVSSSSSIGLQFTRSTSSSVRGVGTDLSIGCESLSCAAITSSTESRFEWATLGVYAQERVGFGDRLFVSGALRADDNSAFGRDFDFVVYPKLSASWLLSDELFFPDWGWVDDLRVRAAFGSSGVQPGALAAVRYFVPVPVTIPVAAGVFRDASGVTFGGIGNADLKPERSTEIEAGVDATLLEGRLGAEVTFYSKKTTDVLGTRPLAPSLGLVPSQWMNLGTIRNRGVEVAIDATVLEAGPISWEVAFTGTTIGNELVERAGAEPTVFFLGLQRHQVGYPLGGFWTRPILGFDDEDGNGILTANEVSVGDTATFTGPLHPTREASLSTSITLIDQLRLAALFDYRGGHRMLNATEALRCQAFRVCRAIHDPATPLEEQARAVAYTYHAASTPVGYIEPGWFVKLREVAATWFMPSSLPARVGASRASLTLSARNVFTWTDYTGMDPEIDWAGGAINYFIGELASQPPVTSLSLRMDVTF